MCLAVPGRIVETYEVSGLTMGKVDFDGVLREACLVYLPEAQIGDYVIVHVGFAISRLSEQEAQESLALLRAVVAAEEGGSAGEEP